MFVSAVNHFPLYPVFRIQEVEVCSDVSGLFRQGTYLSDINVSELRGQREHPEELDLTQCGLQQLVVGHYGLVGDVKMACDAAQVCHLQQNT